MLQTPITLRLKLSLARYFNEEGHEKELTILKKAVDNGREHKVKLTTDSLNVKPDRNDERLIDSITGIKMIFKISSGGCLILIGHLSCSYRGRFGGEFYVTNVVKDEASDFANTRGIERTVLFCSDPITNERMHRELESIKDDPNFVYNFKQYEEFMEIFGYYRTLSNELNNKVSYRIARVSDPFRFVPADVKGIDVDEAAAVKTADGMVIGYRLEDYKYDRLPPEKQERTREYVEITLAGAVGGAKADKKQKGGKGKKSDAGAAVAEKPDRRTFIDAANKIRRFADDLYINKHADIDDESAKSSYTFELACAVAFDDGLSLIGAPYLPNAKKRGGKMNFADFEYLHLYDMGQKIKVDSIAESLRLIKHGGSSAAAALLEYLIGDADMPSESSAPRRATPKKRMYIEDLDPSQKQAFLMAVDGSPVSLIKGPPGTGKTHVINAIVRYITKELGEKVVISSQTHVAIDNVLDKLMESYDIVIPKRITRRSNKYSGDEIDETLYKTWGLNFAEHNRRADNSALAGAIEADMAKFAGEKRFRYSQTAEQSGYSVIGATTTTTAISGKRGLKELDGYDWLIIDEVSKCPMPEVLRYLPYVKHIIMVGDDFQLAPMLELREQDVKGLKSYDPNKYAKLEATYKVSVFDKTLKKADAAGRLCMLDENYRSVKGVLATYNPFYDGALKNRREKIKPQKVKFSGKLKGKNKLDAYFVDVKNGKEIDERKDGGSGTSRYNVEEMLATAHVLSDILENTVDARNVTVSAIFPYSRQLKEFKRRYIELINCAKAAFKSFEIDTVDAFQGRETDIVLVGTVVTDQSRGNFLDEFRRINVAMSRARDKLFVFGNSKTLSRIEMKKPNGGSRRYFADIIDDIRRNGGMIEFKGGIDYESDDKCEIEVE